MLVQLLTGNCVQWIIRSEVEERPVTVGRPAQVEQQRPDRERNDELRRIRQQRAQDRGADEHEPRRDVGARSDPEEGQEGDDPGCHLGGRLPGETQRSRDDDRGEKERMHASLATLRPPASFRAGTECPFYGTENTLNALTNS